MRALTEQETQTLFSKLANYTGRSLTNLITNNDSQDRHVFRLHDTRVYYVRLSIANLATSVARSNLLSLGTCLGKFTKTGKFRLHITALDVIAPHARYKVWVKPNGEMPFLYGGNVLKAHIGRWSEDCPEHQGVVVCSMDDKPLVRLKPLKLLHISNGKDVLMLFCTGLWYHRSVNCRGEKTRAYGYNGVQAGRRWRISERSMCPMNVHEVLRQITLTFLRRMRCLPPD